MDHSLIIEDFGKIKKAEIEIAPFTLFVGDNNSGKSYLLSLIWGIYAAGEYSVLFQDIEKVLQEDYPQIYEALYRFIQLTAETQEQEIQISSKILVEILNVMLARNKNRFAAEIFNSEQVTIGRLAVALKQEFEVTIKGEKKERIIQFFYTPNSGISFSDSFSGYDGVIKTFMANILLWFLKNKYCFREYNTVYLPAARTGFMLAKNVINRVGRQLAYDRLGLHIREEIQPFTKPVIQFLNKMEELSLNYSTLYETIAAWMEESMVYGHIQYGSEVSDSEIRYVPKGSRESIPLRTTSAVVTELTPILLFLKYGKYLEALCYEEPEMCLHPRLQQEMGKLLIRLVNSGMHLIVTTHSDIIIQHINNMCRLKEMNSPKELMEKLELTEKDVIDLQEIRIYQFTDLGACSLVEKVIPEEGEFPVKTFSNALMKILEQTTEVQDFEGE